MKKIFLLCLIPFLLSGCIKRDSMEDITIYTTNYATEYITNYLYGTHSLVKSIYPDGVIIDEYTLTDTQIEEYSSNDLFIFNGLSNEKDYILPMLKHNRKLKIIDTSYSMEFDYINDELWLNPSNFLMLAQNIKNGLDEYINNQYLKNDILKKYEELKVNVSNMDAKIYLTVNRCDSKNIVVANSGFNFLSKYGINVYSIDDRETIPSKTLEDVKNLMKSGEIKYIIINEYDIETELVKELVNTYNVKIVRFNSLSNINEDDRKNKKDYISLMNENIDIINNELSNE